MKVLVACEESQRVCQAFRDGGHEAYSCDILPTRGEHPEWHIQDKVEHILTRTYSRAQDGSIVLHATWDMMIAFPECKYLTNSGVRWLLTEPGRFEKMKVAAAFFKMLLYAPIPRIAIENPIMHKYAREEIGVGPGQIVQPWWFGNFGENESKATGLWLKNLPALKPVNPLPAPHRQSVHHMAPSDTRSRDRAVTFKGIAGAMATRWGNL